MLEILNNLYMTFVEFTKVSPVIAGAVSLWGLCVITYLFKFIPATFNFFKRQVMTSLEFNNAGYEGNDAQFKLFMRWFLTSKSAKWSRYLSLDGNIGYRNLGGEDYVVGAGYGIHFFIYRYRLFWFYKTKLDSSGSEKEKQHITIFTLGRNHKPLLNLIADFSYKPKKEELGIYVFKQSNNASGWHLLKSIKKRPLKSVILEKTLKNRLMDNLEYFFNNKKWFDDRGLAYKQTYIFHGKPGTGKSSLIKAFASHYNKNVCMIDMALMCNSSFETAMSTVPDNSFVLIEDVDECGAVHDRKFSKEEESLMKDPLTLSKVLNVLDGIVALNDTVVFFTTNHLDSLDPAMMRKGRVDYIFEIGSLKDAEIKEYIALMYPNKPELNKTFADINGCDIQSKFLECKEDYDKFISMLPEEDVHRFSRKKMNLNHI